MRYTVVTEGPSDVVLLRAVLGVAPGNTNVSFVAAGGWSSADSLARSLLVREQNQVALVVDADTADPNQAEERKRFLESSLNQISNKSRWSVTVFTPAIETILFENDAILQELIGDQVHVQDILRARYEPQKVLRELIHGKPLVAFLEEKLPKIDLTPLQQARSIVSLIRFLGLPSTTYGKRHAMSRY